MFRQFVSLIWLYLTISGYSNAAEEENGFMGGSITLAPHLEGGIGQSGIAPLESTYNTDPKPFGAPVVVLPLSLPQNGQSAANIYGLHYPGSYIPRDTPLHRFNGYVVCDPPDAEDKVVGAHPGADSAKGADKQATRPHSSRLAKTTSTRPLAAPGYLQPCPIYTINGHIQRNSGYSTTTPR